MKLDRNISMVNPELGRNEDCVAIACLSRHRHEVSLLSMHEARARWICCSCFRDAPPPPLRSGGAVMMS